MINIETADPIITTDGFRATIVLNGKVYVSVNTYSSRDSARRQARKLVTLGCKKKGGGKGK